MIVPNSLIDGAWISEVIAELPGADLYTRPDWGALVLDVGAKQFGRYGTNASGHRILTLKGDPIENEALRQEFPEVVPGYYSNKKHWNSVLLEARSFPDDRLREMIVESYSLVFATLTKRLRDEILGA